MTQFGPKRLPMETPIENLYQPKFAHGLYGIMMNGVQVVDLLLDRKVNNGPNMPFGQGDTPVALLLQLMSREKWTFPADIELEYKVPQDSDAVAEVKKCVQFCRESLA